MPVKKAKTTASASELEKLLAKQKAKQKAVEKQLAQAKAQLLIKRNKELLDEEDEEAPPKKKTKSSSAPTSDSFEQDDSAGLSGLLGSSRVTTDDDKSSKASSIPADSDDEDQEASAEDELPTAMQDDEMVTDEPVLKRKRAAVPRKASTGTATRVTQSSFSPASVRLANVGRSAVRVSIATKQGFPTDHTEFAWDAMSAAVAVSDVPELVERLTAAETSDERRAQLTTYAWSGAAQIRGEIKTHCKGAVALYGIPGEYTPTQIAAHVKWLTGKKGIFKYGGVNLKTLTYDVQQPYGASFYQDVITKQWFDTHKFEGVRAASLRAYVDCPVPTLTIVTGGMLNSLLEWSTGVRIQIKFTEEEYAPQYQRHHAALLNLQAKSPTWFAQFQRKLYSKIISGSNFPHLKEILAPPDEDELDGVDFEALEAHATGKDKVDAIPGALDAAA
ncbi:hypothetical protein GGX14DRAFT_562772 [Mycena pura]|uniref:DUF6532 domain-containing protein n=1 Tax=Mycena pura TaxID=153505 RepID=A0AAD6VKH2_9AGAR|nr:hypothetical protein GGX14DRAFT_562772 [Mycena pura]